MSGRAFGGRHLDRQRARANVAEGRWPACPRQAQVRGDDKQLSWLSRRAEPSRTQVDRRGAKAGLGCRHRRCADGGRMARSRDCRRHVRPSNGRFRDARADAPAIGDRRIADGQVQSTALEWPDLSIAAVDTPAATAGTTPRPKRCSIRRRPSGCTKCALRHAVGPSPSTALRDPLPGSLRSGAGIDWLLFYHRRRLHATPGYLGPIAFPKKRHAGKDLPIKTCRKSKARRIVARRRGTLTRGQGQNALKAPTTLRRRGSENSNTGRAKR
jgi:hypothetical protein